MDLATEAGAAALLVVNPGETVYTLQDHGNYTSSIPMWNMDYKCGAAMSYLVSQGTLTIIIPHGLLLNRLSFQSAEGEGYLRGLSPGLHSTRLLSCLSVQIQPPAVQTWLSSLPGHILF